MAYPGFVDGALQKKPLTNQNEVCTEENSETAVLPYKDGITIHGLFQRDVFIPSETVVMQFFQRDETDCRIILFAFDPDRDLLQYSVINAAGKGERTRISNFLTEVDRNPFIYPPDITELKRNLLAVKNEKPDADFYLRIITASGKDKRWFHFHVVRPETEENLLVGWANAHETQSVTRQVELQIAAAAREAHSGNMVFFSAYNLETNEVIHFPGEVLPDEIRGMESFSDIKSFYVDYVHENDVKEMLFTELRLNNSVTNSLDREKVIFEGRIIPPSSTERKYIWVEITFSVFKGENGKQICSVLARNITEQKMKNEELLRRANMDPYSTVLPRMSFEEFCASQRKNRVMESWLNAVLLIEIGAVEKPADSLSCLDLMDEIARKTEAVLKKHINAKTFASKFGEAVYLMSMHDLMDVNILRERVFSLQDELIKALHDENLAVYIGVALCHHDKESGFRCVYNDVARALDSAKRTGKNQVVFYKPDMNEDSASKGDKHVFIRTFSNFDVFVNDTPINFKNKKTKELLAVLTDRRGGFVSNTEAAGLLWEDEPINKQVRAKFRKIAMWLNNTLSEYGIEDIIEVNGRSRRIRTDKVSCDLYNYLSHKAEYADTYGGFYMNEYSWAEFTTAELNKELFIE